MQNIVDKYGAEILDDFELLETRPFWNLVDIGSKYGFTREYARQIYNKLYNTGYMKLKKAKTAELEKRIVCRNDPRYKVAEYKKYNHKKGAEAELLFYNKCKELGFVVALLCDTIIDIKVNGYYVDVKSCYSPKKPSPKMKDGYYPFVISEN